MSVGIKDKAIYIVLKSFDVKCLDLAVQHLVSLAKQQRALYRGPIPLPMKRNLYTVNRSVHIYKTAMDQLERVVHRRVLCVQAVPTFIEAISQMVLNSGVGVSIKYQNKTKKEVVRSSNHE